MVKVLLELPETTHNTLKIECKRTHRHLKGLCEQILDEQAMSLVAYHQQIKLAE